MPRGEGLEREGLCEPPRAGDPALRLAPWSQASTAGPAGDQEKAESTLRHPHPRLPGTQTRPAWAGRRGAGQQCRIFMKALRNSMLKVV